MRTLDPTLKAATQLDYTEPLWLVQIDMGSTILRASGREQVTWNSQTWQELGLAVEDVDNDALEVSLDNSDHSVSLLCLGNDIKGNAIQAWLYYAGVAQLRFTGVLDSWDTERGTHRVIFYGSSVAAKAGKFPPVVIQEGTWNHIPPPGTVVMAGDQPIVLESNPS